MMPDFRSRQDAWEGWLVAVYSRWLTQYSILWLEQIFDTPAQNCPILVLVGPYLTSCYKQLLKTAE